MKFSFAALTLATTVAADLVTYTSSIVSSTCLLQPYYGNSTSGETIIYEIEEVTGQKTIDYIKTICDGGDCIVTTQQNVLSTVVTTIDGVLTTYVTEVPVDTIPSSTQVDSYITTAVDDLTTHSTATGPANNEIQGVMGPNNIAFIKTICDGGECIVTTEQKALTTIVTTIYGTLTTYVTLVDVATSSSEVDSYITATPETDVSTFSSLANSTLNKIQGLKVQGLKGLKANPNAVVETVCDGGECVVTTDQKVLTTVVATIDGTLTTYVTLVEYLPTSSAELESYITSAPEENLTISSSPSNSTINQVQGGKVQGLKDLKANGPNAAIKTVCNGGECVVTMEQQVLTTVVATIDGTLTTYVTVVDYLPTPSSETGSYITTAPENFLSTSSIANSTLNKIQGLKVQGLKGLKANPNGVVETVCDGGECVVTTDQKVLTTVVATIDGTLTTYVTLVEYLPTSSAQADSYATTTSVDNVTTYPTAADSDIYEIEEVMAQETVQVATTICDGGDCVVTTVQKVLTTVVTTVDGTLTTYVTAIPVNDLTTSSTSAELVTVTAVPVEDLTTSSTPADAAEYVTVTNLVSTVVTITSCSSNTCQENVVTTGLTTVTTEVGGIFTTYVTYCPLSSENTSTERLTGTTVVTITSCSDNQCSRVPVTTGYVLSTGTLKGTKTVYTTFCPLTTTEADKTKPNVITESTEVVKATIKSENSETTTKTAATAKTETTEKAETTVKVEATKAKEGTVANSGTAEVKPETTGVVSEATGVKSETTGVVSDATEVEPETTSESDVTTRITTAKTFSIPADTTVNVITNNIITQSFVASALSLPGAVVSTYQGNANRVLPVIAGIVPVFFMLM